MKTTANTLNSARTFWTLLVGLVLCVGVMIAPAMQRAAYAQDGDVKSLEELMNEVDEEEGANDEAAQEPVQGEEGGGVKSLEELMNEVDEEDGDATQDGDTPASKVEVADEFEGTATELKEPTAASAHSDGPGATFWLGLVGILVLCILLGAPLYVLIGSLTLYLLLFGGVFSEFRFLASIIEQTRSLSDKEVLLAIPFFVVSGALMTEGDISQRLINFADALFGRLPGGLAISTVFACAFFAAISGSSPVTVIAIGSIMYPALIKKGYPDDFSTGLVTSGGSLGILIPPSIPMIVYAIVDPTKMRDPKGYDLTSGGGGDASVSDLFLAGMGPGILIGLVLMFYSFRTGLLMQEVPQNKRILYYAMFIGFSLLFPVLAPFGLLGLILALCVGGVLNLPNMQEKRESIERKVNFDLVGLWVAFKDGFWALFLPILILGGIYSGAFTPTQAAAVAVVYAVFVEFFVHRSLTLKDLPKIFTESVILMGSLFVIIALALGFNMYLDRAKIPEAAVELILGMDLSIITFLLIINVLLLIVGFFMDILSAILILVPLLAPIAAGLGIHPLHLAVVFIVNLEIGYLTPPIGLNLFVAGTLFKKGIGEVVRSVLPFVTLMLGCLLLVTYVPTISLGPVAAIKGKNPIITFPDREAILAQEKAEAEAEAKKAQDAKRAAEDKKEQPSDGGVKSLEELMNEVDDEEDAADEPADGAVKSLEELMNEVDEEEAQQE